jgi:hypothetical protein
MSECIIIDTIGVLAVMTIEIAPIAIGATAMMGIGVTIAAIE